MRISIMQDQLTTGNNSLWLSMIKKEDKIKTVPITNDFYQLKVLCFVKNKINIFSLIRERKKIGCHEVAMVHSSQLIDLRYKHSDLISFHYNTIQDYPGKISCTVTECNQENSDFALALCIPKIKTMLGIF